MILVSPLASEIELETRESGDPLKIEWDYLEKGIVRDACSQACPVLSCLSPVLSQRLSPRLLSLPPTLICCCWKNGPDMLEEDTTTGTGREASGMMTISFTLLSFLGHSSTGPSRAL